MVQDTLEILLSEWHVTITAAIRRLLTNRSAGLQSEYQYFIEVITSSDDNRTSGACNAAGFKKS